MNVLEAKIFSAGALELINVLAVLADDMSSWTKKQQRVYPGEFLDTPIQFTLIVIQHSTERRRRP